MASANDQYDIAVIGAGPAGASAAITAARAGARVALFESRQFPRHKVCGEFVSAEALHVLSELLGDADAMRALADEAPAIGRTRLWLGTQKLEAAVSPAALSITRFELDAALWEAARTAGVACRDNCEVAGVDGDGPFLLRTPAGEITARALIVAAGRWSLFVADRSLPPSPKWIGLKAHFREPQPDLSTDLYFFEGGYCGVQPISGDAVNACAMVRSDCASSLLEVFRLHPALCARAASWLAITPTVSTAPLLYRVPQPVRGNILFVGDAASFIDPFVGDGISIALRSGKLASECLVNFLARCPGSHGVRDLGRSPSATPACAHHHRSIVRESTLAECASVYQAEYARRFAPLLSMASRIRWALSLPAAAQAGFFELLRLPGVMRLLIHKTRHA